MKSFSYSILRWSFFLSIFIFLGIVPQQVIAAKVKNVLVLHSYHKGLGWTDGIANGIDDILLKSDFQIEIFTEYMDTKRIYSKDYLDKLAFLIKNKYNNKTIDIIISSDDHAFQFLLQHHENLFPSIPVVFCGVNLFKDEFVYAKPYFTGVVESFSIKDTINSALQINPKLQRVYSIVDQTISGKANLELLEQVVPSFNDRIQFNIISNKTMSEVTNEVAQLPPNSIVLLLAFTSDKSGNIFSFERAADLITKASNQPVYSLWDFHLNHGVVGGMLTSGFSQGEAAAKMALRIFKGEKANNIPVLKESPNRYIFDYTALKKFNISIKNLPPKSKVINRPYSFYEDYKIVVWSVLAAFTVLIALILVLSFNVIRRKKVEKELVKHQDHLEELVNERTRELTHSNMALKDSETRYRTLSDASYEGIVISEEGIILETNKAMDKMLGVSEQEAVGRKITDYVVQNKREDVQNKVLSGYENIYESIGLKKNGIQFPVAVQAKMFIYKGRQVRVTAIQDLTEQKKAQEEIKVLKGLLPICSSCKKIRDEKGYWNQLESYIENKSDAAFSHGMCPECSDKFYGNEDWYIKIKKNRNKDK